MLCPPKSRHGFVFGSEYGEVPTDKERATKFSKTTSRAIRSVVIASAPALGATMVAAVPAQAVCTGAYFSVNTAAQASVKVPGSCSNGSQVRARKDWYYTDSTNSTVGTSRGPWISSSNNASTVYLPSGRYFKVNLIESS